MSSLHPSRRTIAKTIAWAAPVVSFGGLAPAASASTVDPVTLPPWFSTPSVPIVLADSSTGEEATYYISEYLTLANNSNTDIAPGSQLAFRPVKYPNKSAIIVGLGPDVAISTLRPGLAGGIVLMQGYVLNVGVPAGSSISLPITAEIAKAPLETATGNSVEGYWFTAGTLTSDSPKVVSSNAFVLSPAAG